MVKWLNLHALCSMEYLVAFKMMYFSLVDFIALLKCKPGQNKVLPKHL